MPEENRVRSQKSLKTAGLMDRICFLLFSFHRFCLCEARCCTHIPYSTGLFFFLKLFPGCAGTKK